MSQYIYMTYLSLKTAIVYKAEVWFGVFAAILTLSIKVFLWKVLYASNGESVGISFEYMVTYLILSTALSAIFFDNIVLLEVGRDVREGIIANYLAKPYSYKWSILARFLGKSMFRLLFVIGPMLVIAITLYGFTGPHNWYSLILSIIVTTLSFYMFFSIYFIGGLSAFWFMDIHGAVPLLLENIMMILSGFWIPLWLFPEWLSNIAYLLPMRFGFDLPLSVYVGRATSSDIYYGIVLQLIWLLLLWLISGVVWRIGVRKLAIQGG